MSSKTASQVLCLTAIGAVYLGYNLITRRTIASTDTDGVIKERHVGVRMLNDGPIVEVCLSDIISLRNAVSGEANSVELCVNRLEGGVTPSLGLIEEAVRLLRATTVSLNVLIRPRAGDFVYTPEECEVIQRDILSAKAAGADGIVFGALTREGRVDKELMRVVRLLSEGMTLTFHRAFDVCSDDLHSALEDVIALGCERVLTSGRASSVAEGGSVLAAIVSQAAGRIKIVAGCGVTVDNAAEVVERTGVHGVHAGSAVTEKVRNVLSTAGSSSTFVSEDMCAWDCVSASKVALLVERAGGAWKRSVAVNFNVCGATYPQDCLEATPQSSTDSVETRDSDSDKSVNDTAGAASSLERSYVYVKEQNNKAVHTTSDVSS